MNWISSRRFSYLKVSDMALFSGMDIDAGGNIIAPWNTPDSPFEPDQKDSKVTPGTVSISPLFSISRIRCIWADISALISANMA